MKQGNQKKSKISEKKTVDRSTEFHIDELFKQVKLLKKRVSDIEHTILEEAAEMIDDGPHEDSSYEAYEEPCEFVPGVYDSLQRTKSKPIDLTKFN